MKAEQNRLLGLLGIARRGGKITSGFDAVRELISDKKDVLVLLAMDLSAKTEKELRYAAGENKEIFKIPFTKDEVGKAIGLPSLSEYLQSRKRACRNRPQAVPGL